MLRAIRRRRDSLAHTPGLAVARLCVTTELEPTFGGRPTPTRWALLCGWEDGSARDRFLADPEPLRPFLEPAREAWSVSLDTVRLVSGEWRGWRPSTDDVDALGRDEPLAVITYGRLRPRYVPTFMWNNRKAVRQIVRHPGLISMVGLSDGIGVASTFSLWRSQGDVVRYAYGPGVHKPIQRRSLDVPWASEWFFARFRPVASSGTWSGRDPLALPARELAAVA
jgi:hypothetical protein